jgi:hypothetical protein
MSSEAPKTDQTKPSLSTRLRYYFDAALSRGPVVVIGWLGLITLVVILISSLVLTLFRIGGVAGEGRVGFIENLWQSMLRLLDPGTFSGDAGWVTRPLMLLVTLAGIFIAGSLIGIIANGIDQRVEELRKGRSTVIENDHTVILGWSDRVAPIVAELTIANESRKRPAVVILADQVKTDMEDVLKDQVRETRGTTLVCRSGEPWSLDNLAMVNVTGARSIVIVGADDVAAIKTVLAVRAQQQTAAAGMAYAGHIVVEVASDETARSLRSLLGENLVTVSSTNVVAEITAQACRQRGLSEVFRELLDFDGDEFYIDAFPSLVGQTYAQCQLAFEQCSVIGVLDSTGGVSLNPPSSRVFGAGEQLVGIAADDSLFTPTSGGVAGSVQATEQQTVSTERRRIVVSGWSSLGPRVVVELDEFMDPGTIVEVVVDPSLVTADSVRSGLQTRNVEIRVEELRGGPEEVATHAARELFHEVIVLGYRDVMSIDRADARTLLTLVAFRRSQPNPSGDPLRIVAEVLDQRNAPLAQASGADDFIVSDELTSMMLAQLSERAELVQVFDDLFDRDGCAVELRPARWFGATTATCFADIVATASSLEASAIGYRLASTGEVVLNPAKSAPLTLAAADQVIIIAHGMVAAEN